MKFLMAIVISILPVSSTWAEGGGSYEDYGDDDNGIFSNAAPSGVSETNEEKAKRQEKQKYEADFNAMSEKMAKRVTSTCPKGTFPLSNAQILGTSNQKYYLVKGCAKRVNNDVIVESGVVVYDEAVNCKNSICRRWSAEMKNGVLNGQAEGLDPDLLTSTATYVNDKLHGDSNILTKTSTADRIEEMKVTYQNGIPTKMRRILTNRANNFIYEEEVGSFDKKGQKTGDFRKSIFDNLSKQMLLTSTMTYNKDNLLKAVNYAKDGKTVSEVIHYKGQKNSTSAPEHELYKIGDDGVKINCFAPFPAKDKTSFYEACVEGGNGFILKLSKTLERVYPEIETVKDQLGTKHSVEFDFKRKCIKRGAENRQVTKFNPSTNVPESKNSTFTSVEIDEMYTLLLSSPFTKKSSKQDFDDFCQIPRSTPGHSLEINPRVAALKSAGELKKAVFCK